MHLFEVLALRDDLAQAGTPEFKFCVSHLETVIRDTNLFMGYHEGRAEYLWVDGEDQLRS